MKELKPANAVGIVETDLNVDFDAPVGYDESLAASKAAAAASAAGGSGATGAIGGSAINIPAPASGGMGWDGVGRELFVVVVVGDGGVDGEVPAGHSFDCLVCAPAGGESLACQQGLVPPPLCLEPMYRSCVLRSMRSSELIGMAGVLRTRLCSGRACERRMYVFETRLKLPGRGDCAKADAVPFGFTRCVRPKPSTRVRNHATRFLFVGGVAPSIDRYLALGDADGVTCLYPLSLCCVVFARQRKQKRRSTRHQSSCRLRGAAPGSTGRKHPSRGRRKRRRATKATVLADNVRRRTRESAPEQLGSFRCVAPSLCGFFDTRQC